MQELGKYEIVEEIGRGGFAVVYRARDTELDRFVALKVLDPYWSKDQGFVTRFRQEARAAARLCHPNVVTVHDAGEVDGQLYIAMELLPGRTLRELLEVEGALELERSLPILEQLARALDYAHRQGIVHRDVKPGNVMVKETPDGIQATLVDFGLVKALSGSTALTSQGTLLGSPEYMAPEQADPSRTDEIGPASDRYAFGVVAYHMLTGRVPFSGPTTAVLYAHVYEPPPAPQSVREDISEGIAQALLKALAKKSKDRFQSGEALVEALREPVLVSPAPGQALPWKWIVGIGASLVVLALLGWGLSRLFLDTDRPIPTPTASTAVALAPTATPSPLSTDTPFPALTDTPEATATDAPAPTLGPEAGATRIWEKDESVMVYVPAGKFLMGSTENTSAAEDDERPQHEVYLDAFWIDRTEVTNAQYALFLTARRNQEEGGATWFDVADEDSLIVEVGGEYQPKSGYADHPVVEVSWYGARAYCEWAGKGLPTEAQWEKTARGTDGRFYPWGDTFDSGKLNFRDESADDGYARTAPVGSYPQGASPYGAMDMVGNVHEWVADWYDGGYYASSPEKNPPGPDSGDGRVMRGGSWNLSAMYARAADRSSNNPAYTFDAVGFRCVHALP